MKMNMIQYRNLHNVIEAEIILKDKEEMKIHKSIRIFFAKAFVLALALSTVSISGFAQIGQTIYVLKNSIVMPVPNIDNVTFEEATVGDSLFVHKKNNFFIDKLSLNEIQQISFSEEDLTVEMLNGNKAVYAIKDIAKLIFKNNNATGIYNPSVQNSFDVLVRVNPAGDVVVESPVAIKALTIYSIDGKMISQQSCKSAEKQCVASLQGNASGIYFLQVETEQGTITKKIINPLNK